ncbi:MAG: hypothetical protein K1X92_11665 [Bacteroidia bacterium]|nr:hypothetical protein [Bacteroidia bacterium]
MSSLKRWLSECRTPIM